MTFKREHFEVRGVVGSLVSGRGGHCAEAPLCGFALIGFSHFAMVHVSSTVVLRKFVATLASREWRLGLGLLDGWRHSRLNEED